MFTAAHQLFRALELTHLFDWLHHFIEDPRFPALWSALGDGGLSSVLLAAVIALQIVQLTSSARHLPPVAPTEPPADAHHSAKRYVEPEPLDLEIDIDVTVRIRHLSPLQRCYCSELAQLAAAQYARPRGCRGCRNTSGRAKRGAGLPVRSRKTNRPSDK